jgi:uncharacterized protein (DUF2132 family)
MMSQIKINGTALAYLTELSKTIEVKGFSKEDKVAQALDYVCERAAWLKENQDNLYTYREVDSKQKLIKVNFK